MQRELSAYFEDIVLSIDKIERYTMGMSKEMLNRNEMILDAVVRNLEIIGEAVKKIPGLRDILIHEYFGINTNIIWDVVENKLSPLKQAVMQLQGGNSLIKNERRT